MSSHIDAGILDRMRSIDMERSTRRRQLRDALRFSSDAMERYAVMLAEKGYGTAHISYRTGLPIAMASILVVGS